MDDHYFETRFYDFDGKDASTHHAIPMSRIAQWKDRWEVLGIFPDPTQ